MKLFEATRRGNKKLFEANAKLSIFTKRTGKFFFV